MRANTIRYVVYGLALTVVLAGMVGTISAQEGASPSATLSAASIDIQAGDQTTVSATYSFDVSSAGSGDNALSAISGTMWGFPEHEVGEVSAIVNGNDVTPTVDRQDRYMTVSVPVESVSDGDTVKVTLEYTVADPAGELKTPLWVPEFQTGGSAAVVEMNVMLPDDTQVQGAAFPKVDSRDGSTLSYKLLHMPGFVSVSYGSGTGGFLTLDVISSVVGVGLILGFLGSWLAWRRNLIGSGGESSVI